MRQKINLIGLAAVTTTIIYGSLSTGTPVSAGGLPIHFVAYFVLASALLINFHDTKKGHIEAIAASGLLALALEITQAFLPMRTFSLIDFGVSFAGASVITLDHHINIVTKLVRLEDKMIEKLLLN